MIFAIWLLIINSISFLLHWRYDAPSLYLQFIPAYPFGLVAYMGGFPGAFLAKMIKAICGREAVNVPAQLMSFVCSVPFIWSAITFAGERVGEIPFFPIEMHIAANLVAAFILVPALFALRRSLRDRDRGNIPSGNAMLIAEDECTFVPMKHIPPHMAPADLITHFTGTAEMYGMRLKIVPGITDSGTECIVLRHPSLNCRMNVIRCTATGRDECGRALYRYDRAVIGETIYDDPTGKYSGYARCAEKLKQGKARRQAWTMLRAWYRKYAYRIRFVVYVMKRRSPSTAMSADTNLKNEIRWYRAVEKMIKETEQTTSVQ